MYSYIDMHCDSLLRVLSEGEESLYHGKGMQSIQRMAKAGQMCQFFAIFFRPEWLEEEKYFETLRNALYKQIEARPIEIAMAHNYAEIQANWSAGRASAILTIEDGRIVNGSLEKLVWLQERGVRAITLTWNVPNCFGYPHSYNKRERSKGLTAFGKEAVREMNRLGMLIDVSHLSDGGFFDVAALSDKPFVASHSNCRALAPHTRNLSDDMIILLAERGGVAGVNLYPPFVEGGEVSDYMEALVSHVLHFIKVGGEECVGIGTDFDGMEEAPMIDCPAKLELLFEALLKRGVTYRQLDKFLRGNVLRVVRETMR
ncbi:MAG: dipeptidase [Lachnospiraceae bacterium]|nr:dipeptidase [Lachnospiraceae bacterium]